MPFSIFIGEDLNFEEDMIHTFTKDRTKGAKVKARTQESASWHGSDIILKDALSFQGPLTDAMSANHADPSQVEAVL